MICFHERHVFNQREISLRWLSGQLLNKDENNDILLQNNDILWKLFYTELILTQN